VINPDLVWVALGFIFLMAGMLATYRSRTLQSFGTPIAEANALSFRIPSYLVPPGQGLLLLRHRFPAPVLPAGARALWPSLPHSSIPWANSY
jgi:hypothetical protein